MCPVGRGRPSQGDFVVPGKIQGKVVAITESGALVTDISAAALREAPTDESVLVSCDEHETCGIYPAEHGQPDSTFLAYIGPRDCLELDIVGVGAGPMLGIRVGQSVTVKW
jgi:hypothetical protein